MDEKIGGGRGGGGKSGEGRNEPLLHVEVKEIFPKKKKKKRWSI